MYTLKVINNYVYDTIVHTSGKDSIVNHNSSGTFEKLGNAYLSIPGMGQLNLIDLGDSKLDGYNDYPTETWGVLIRYKTTEATYRYEGGGTLTLTIDKLGSVNISTENGTLIEIKVTELTIN